VSATALTEAHQEGERRAATILNERRARARTRARSMLDEADGDAAQIRARAGERTAALGAEIVQRLLEGAS
jgi:vacuolar-type H+-ATPase subunit H